MTMSGKSNHVIDQRDIIIPAGSVALPGILGLPHDAHGIVIFAHGSGSSRFSSRNQYVAHRLQTAGFATLLLDLLTPDEEVHERRTAHLRFNIELLGERLEAALDWVIADERTHQLPVGLFGASTGGAAALVLAARRPDSVHAVVSRGGRPDLAGPALPRVKAPTMLIVGAQDHAVLTLNLDALRAIQAAKDLVVVPNATHLFEEPGALDEVAASASGWFAHHLAPAPISVE